MSHCTTFSIRYTDKRLLFRSMRSLGLRPENKVWLEFPSELKKRLGIGGEIIGKLLTGSTEKAMLFFMETPEGLVPHIESPVLSGAELNRYGAEMLCSLNREYVKGAVYQLADQIGESGGSASVLEHNMDRAVTYTVVLGDPGKSVAVSVDGDGRITERVQGVQGRSCTDLTSPLESLLAGPTQQLERSWSHEYDITVEDRSVQVLRLR